MNKKRENLEGPGSWPWGQRLQMFVLVVLLSSTAVAGLITGTDPVILIIVGFMLVITFTTSRYITSTAVALAIFCVVQLYLAAPAIRLFNAESLDGSLLSGAETYLACGAFVVLALGAAFISRSIRPAILKRFEPTSANELRLFAFLGAVIGLCALLLTAIFGGDFGSNETSQYFGPGTVGVFGKYVAFMYLPIFCYFFWPVGAVRSRVVTGCFLTVSAVCLTAMLFLNARRLGIDLGLSMCVGYAASGRRIQLRQVTFVAVSVAFLLGFVSPLITSMRFDVRNVPFSERFDFILRNFPRYVEIAIGTRPLDDVTRGALIASYLDYAGNSSLSQRLSGVQIADIAINAPSTVGFTADDPVAFGIQRAIPGPLAGDKRLYSFGDLFTWKLGLRSYGNVGAPFVGLLASSIYGYGPVAGVALSGAIALIAFLEISLVAPRIPRSIWGCFVFVALYNPIAEGDVARYIELVLRTLPELLVAGVVFAKAVAIVSRRSILSTAGS